MAIPDLSTIEQRTDGLYHAGKKVDQIRTLDPRGEIAMVHRVNHEKSTLELVLHRNDNWLIGGVWTRVYVYLDGTQSEPIS